MNRPRVPLLDRVLRALVRLLPADFRSDFGSAMEADLTERRLAGDRAGLLRRELPSLLAAIAREHAGAFLMDAKYAMRTMRRTPGFTALAVLMLALGTGVNAAMFSIVDAVLLRTPFVDPDRVATIQVPSEKPGVFWAAVPTEKFAELVAAPGPLASVAALDLGTHIMTGRGDPVQLDFECVSASMFDVLGTRPVLGRPFGADDDRAGAPPVMVLSHPFWHELGGSDTIVGTSITINQTPVTVIGVMPRGFQGPLTRSDVAAWVPIARTIAGGGASGCAPSSTVDAFARVRSDVTIDRVARAIPGVQLVPLNESTFENLRTPFAVLTAAVVCVLLIACFNVGGLQMERTLARRRELALRLALGASHGRLVRQSITENLLLALIGGLGGLLMTAATLRGIVSLLPANLPHLGEIEVNTRVLIAVLAAAMAAGIISGLIPVLQTRHLNPGPDLAGGARATERRSTWTRRALVTIEVALSIVVLIGAALMVQTFLTLRPANPGFDPTNKTSILVRLPGATPEESGRFFAELFDRLRTTPGMHGVVGSTYLPMWGTTRTASWSFGGTTSTANTNYTTPGYFELMKIPTVAGRTFTATDTSSSAPVVVVNDVFARRISPDGRAVGRRINARFGARPDDPLLEYQIVGVIANTRSFGSTTQSRPEAYIPYIQRPINLMFVVAPTDGRNEAEVTAELRSAVRALRPDLAVREVGLMSRWVNQTVSRQRFGAWLLGTFAVLAIGLAAIGLMTTIGWWVHQRTREIGVRRALGASRAQVGRLVVRQGLALAAVGIVVGCAAAAPLTRYLEGSIYGVKPLDPVTFAGCALAMLLVAIGAVYLPMRRATSVDPVIALRVE